MDFIDWTCLCEAVGSVFLLVLGIFGLDPDDIERKKKQEEEDELRRRLLEKLRDEDGKR